jgi:hypothetical protein
MTYSDNFRHLGKIFNIKDPVISIPESGIDIHNIKFSSNSWRLLPGAKEYSCIKHNINFIENTPCSNPVLFRQYPDVLKHDDIDIAENRDFAYSLFKKSDNKKADGVILLLHGLNEKHWDKYLPWAEKLVELTGKAVLLFPIAFHMNRSPAIWSSSHLMNSVAKLRKESSPVITNCTFANAAISARIEMIPQRFFWSGLQTFYDIVTLISEIKKGTHPYINANSKIDLFSYSVGSFLSEILIMTNPREYFTNSRLFMFCGGCTLDRMSPNSRFILDSDATIAIYSFYTERLESAIKMDKRIAHYFNEHVSGNFLKSMLSYKKCKELREKRLTELSRQIYAIALKKDDVISPAEVINTLQGDFRDIPIKVDMMDFKYPYSHIKPFPEDKIYSSEVDEEFNRVFNNASAFLS